MIPVVTPDEMRAIDANAREPVEVLIARAGAAVARSALELLGGAYGRRVTVVCGPGNNGADGRAAAVRMERRGVRVTIVPVDRGTPPAALTAPADLIIDAAYGTGFRGVWVAPELRDAGTAVLAVDIPSGVDGLTGEVDPESRPWEAVRTVTFAALKPGLLLAAGAELAGDIEVVDIGLGAASRTHVLTDDDVVARMPARARSAHKWDAPVLVVGGSPGLTGAPELAALAAFRGGAGMVRVAVPGGDGSSGPIEAVGLPLPSDNWVATVLRELERGGALVVGPGLGRRTPMIDAVRQLVGRSPVPVVVDADGLAALANTGPGDTATGEGPASKLPGRRAVQQAQARRSGTTLRSPEPLLSRPLAAVRDALATRATGATVLTPHDGEFLLLAGSRPGPDRLADVRRVAAATGAVVLLKGPTTIVADPDGSVELVTAGDARLATAGTGDVLAGLIAAFIAQGMDPFRAASTAAHVHARAARRGHARGLIAGDLPELVAQVLS